MYILRAWSQGRVALSKYTSPILAQPTIVVLSSHGWNAKKGDALAIGPKSHTLNFTMIEECEFSDPQT